MYPPFRASLPPVVCAIVGHEICLCMLCICVCACEVGGVSFVFGSRCRCSVKVTSALVSLPLAWCLASTTAPVCQCAGRKGFIKNMFPANHRHTGERQDGGNWAEWSRAGFRIRPTSWLPTDCLIRSGAETEGSVVRGAITVAAWSNQAK